MDFETVRDRVFDTYQRLDPLSRPNSRTVLIDIDAQSLRQAGQWPWSRDQLASLIDRVSGAKVIGLDLLLLEPDRLSPGIWAADRSNLPAAVRQALIDLPSTDSALSASMSRAPVVLAAVADGSQEPRAPARPMTPIVESGGDPERGLARYEHVAWPLPRLALAASGVGLVSVMPEPDGVMRRLPLVANVNGTLMPSFDAEILRVAAGAGHIGWHTTTFGKRQATIGELRISADHAGRVWPRYGTGPQPRRIPAYQVLSGGIPEEAFRNRIVLIGSSAAGLADVLVTPLGPPETGMQIEANLLESVLSGDTLWRPAAAPTIELLVALALGLAAALLIYRVSVLVYVMTFSGLTLGVIVSSFLAFAALGLLIDWTLPVSSLVVCMLAAFAVRAREEALARRRHTADLAAALFQAEAGDRAKTEFLANASHELRTPLNAIIGFSEIMAMEMYGPILKTYAEYSRDIHMSATHLLSIINDMLDLTVIDLGGREPADDKIEIALLVAECERMAAPRSRDRKIGFMTEMPVPLPTLLADTRMVRQMLLNLISNAVKYSPAGGTVYFAAMVDVDGWLCLSVRDEGPGIAPADLPNVLKRFARLRSSTLAQEPGIGIGLVLTKSMVELHGGRLKITSELKRGTEAILCFPPARLVQPTRSTTCEAVPQLSCS